MIKTLKDSGLLLASGNAGKLAELQTLLAPLQINVMGLHDFEQPYEVEETEPDFQGNAALKARAGYVLSGIPSLADDSGLCVDALDGAPGVYSARFGGPGLDDAGRCQLLLDKLKAVAKQNRTARFQCVLAFCYGPADSDIDFFQGSCEGHIADEPSGQGGFGYDPVFLDAETGRAFAELSPAEKNSRSHRGRALAEFINFLNKVQA